MTELYNLKQDKELFKGISQTKIVELTSSQHSQKLPGERVSFRQNDTVNLYRLDSIYLDIPITIKKQDKSDYTQNNKIQLTNFTALSVWSEIEFLINNVTIERVSNPYYGILMQKICSDTNNDALSNFVIEDSKTDLNEYLNKTLVDSDYKLVFRFSLKEVVGFLNADKVFFGGFLSFNLTREKDDMILYRLSDGDAFSVEIKDVKMFIKQTQLNNKMSEYVEKQRNSIKNISYTYLHKTILTALISSNKSWQYNIPITDGQSPISILMSFYPATLTQTVKKDVFNHCFVEDAYVEINSVKYPHTSLKARYHENDYNNYYNTISEYFKDYKGKDEFHYDLSKTTYKNIYPIIWFDLRHQDNYGKINGAQINLRFKDDFNVNNNYYVVFLIETPTKKINNIINKHIYRD